VPELQQIWDELLRTRFWVILLQLALVVIFTLIALRFTTVTVRTAVGRLFAREAAEGTAPDLTALELNRRKATIEGLINRALRVIILVIAFLMAMRVLNLDIGPAIAGLGIIGLAVSLGTQNLVRDYVAGAFVLIENQYSKGDLVQIGNQTGTVEDFSLRRTVLRGQDGSVHFVPHGLLQTTTNLSRNWAGISLDIPVPYEEDLPRMTAAIDAAGARLANDPLWQNVVFEQPRVMHVERLAEAGITVHVGGSVAALHRRVLPGILRGLILEEAGTRGLTLGWRAVPQKPEEPPDEPPQESDGQPEDAAGAGSAEPGTPA